jgi:hypothetical protein
MTDASSRYQPQSWNVPEKHIIHLQPKRIIGSGSFGKLLLSFHRSPTIGYVFEAIDKANNDRKVAIKRTTKAGEFVSREFEVLERLRDCPNCI